MKETWIWCLGQEDPLEREMTAHSSILTWETPWTEGPGRQQFMNLQRVRQDWATNNNNKDYLRPVIKAQVSRVFQMTQERSIETTI